MRAACACVRQKTLREPGERLMARAASVNDLDFAQQQMSDDAVVLFIDE